MALGSDPTNGGDAPDNDSNPFDGHPFTWVLVPICILVAAAICIAFFRYRKRNALRRDLEATQTGPSQLGRDHRSMWGADRRHPHGQRRRRTGVGVGSREEGLNELGEAPPAYQKTPEDTELRDMTTPPTAVHMIPEFGTRVGPVGDLASPPAYGEAPQSNEPINQAMTTSEETQRPSTPVPAALRSRQQLVVQMQRGPVQLLNPIPTYTIHPNGICRKEI
ncbi:hypothetical protein BJ170DRAFT_679575 [Xylariales sp. AK1849]|nr:hypothetical protein BJ170DRAFT_679575 [Xylariales sp. AK1849]